jgi:hypothetical protein
MKAHVSVPFLELLKIPAQKENLEKFLGFEEVTEVAKDDPIVLQTMNQGRMVVNVLFPSLLLVNDMLLHNCMIDSGASTNVMPLKVMNQLGLKTTRPYRNVCAMDLREIKVLGLIKDLQLSWQCIQISPC